MRKTVKTNGAGHAYFDAVHAARRGGVDAEPEAQLTVPFSELVRAVAADAGLPKLSLIRETRQDHIRPDFAALAGQRFAGHVELKAPDVTIDADRWTGRNAKQWAHLCQLDALIVSNGRQVRLYAQGLVQGADATLPYDEPDEWKPDGLVAMLGRFVALRPKPVTHVTDLAKRLALPTRDLRDRLHWLLRSAEADGHAAASKAYGAWRDLVHPHCTHDEFASDVAQVISYGLVLAALTTARDSDDGLLTAAEARVALRAPSPVVSASFGPLLDNQKLTEAVRAELGALEALVSSIDRDAINKSTDIRGEPWLYFYEDFLAIYDPDQRKQAGVYFTPIDAVQAITAIDQHLLVTRFDRRLGFADPSVVTLDPSTGSGTFPLDVIDRGVSRAKLVRGAAGAAQAAHNMSTTIHAFELLPGPYAVAQLRIAERLRVLGAPPDSISHVILTDTLESPEAGPPQPNLFGDNDVLAEEQKRARSVKLTTRVTVALGNPPYRRESAESGSGGWTMSGVPEGRATPIFADILDVARAHTNFSHVASLYNLYVYFWRWTIWKVFEAQGAGQGIVSFITASSWLAGPGFMGLRQLARQLCDEIFVLDLGGDNRGSSPEQNIFAIETPVAIVVLVRTAATSDRSALAPVRYRRIHGTRKDKLDALHSIAVADDPLGGPWLDAPTGARDPFVPPTGQAQWQDMPLLSDLFPWQQPGCKFGRLWPIAPSKPLLQMRWKRFASSKPEERPALFQTGTSGRNVHTQVGDMKRLADVSASSRPQPVVRYGYRSFDRQWAFDDPRMAKTDSPALWQSKSDRQVFLASQMTKLIGEGPVLTVSAHVPDLDYYCGRGGKDIIPLYRDATARDPNITDGLLQLLRDRLVTHIEPEDFVAYVYAILSCCHFQSRFAQELQTAGPRVPLTTSATFFRQAVVCGRRLLWLHTFAERFRDPGKDRNAEIPHVSGIGWSLPVSTIPAQPAAISWNADTEELVVGDGIVTGVRKAVWEYQVSGMPVLRKWLGYRTAKGAGRAAVSDNPLDLVRPTTWSDDWNDELLDLLRVLTLTVEGEIEQAALVDRICDGPLIAASDCPEPRDSQRGPPATITDRKSGTLF